MFAADGVRATDGKSQIGQPAPELAVQDSKGAGRNLSEFRGKPVISERTNADLSVYAKALQPRQRARRSTLAQKGGMIWLSVISSATGKQWYVEAPSGDALTESRRAPAYAAVLPVGVNAPSAGVV